MRKIDISCSILCVLLWLPPGVRGDEGTPDWLVKLKPTSEYVKYEGTLICFRCDITPTPESRARCEQEGHAPLLKRTEGRTRRLYGSKNAITDKLTSEELHGKRVKVEGIYDSKTNWLLVDKVEALER